MTKTNELDRHCGATLDSALQGAAVPPLVATDVPKIVVMPLLNLYGTVGRKQCLDGHRTVRGLIERLEEFGVVVELNRPDLVNGAS